MHFYYLKVTFL